MKKRAFTLAEVLITLGIIGVVAAMTIPSLIAKISANYNQTKFKKTVASLSQAAKRSQSEYGFDFAGLKSQCSQTPNVDNPETTLSICAILNGTLSGASVFKLQNLNLKNGTKYIASIKSNMGNNATFLKRGEYMLSNGIAYILPDGVLVAINAKAGMFPCTLDITEQVLDTNPTGVGLSECFGFIDVNGVSLPNREVSCSSGDDTLAKNTCIVNYNNMTDIYPIRFHDGSIEAGSAAARYVLRNGKL